MIRINMFCPKIFVPSVTDIDLAHLKGLGLNTLLLDLDNTLVSWRSKKIADKVQAWLNEAFNLGFKMCIISNCIFRGRVHYFAKKLGIPAIHRGVKPRQLPFKKALQMLEITPEKTAVIGDQMFTDILGGNILGAFTILVKPVDKREYWATIIQRTAEKIILFRLRRLGILNEIRTN